MKLRVRIVRSMVLTDKTAQRAKFPARALRALNSARISSGCTALARPGAISTNTTNRMKKRRSAVICGLRRYRIAREAAVNGASRKADPETPIGQRHNSSERHHDRANPDCRNERLPEHVGIDPTIRVLVPERDVDLPKT